MTLDARAPTLVADRYELHERVGQGGCGVVYRATDQHTGHPVAIKMLNRAARQDPSFVERLVREQQALQARAGTHAVGAIDLCRAGTGELCLVMEWLEGIDLEQRLTELEQLGTPLGADELWRVLEPVLQTLEKAHELGIVHRDIKPANIFLLARDRGVRLLDFGFSRLKSSATLTAADAVMGSPSYISPEAWQHGSKAIEKQADLYAAGVIVFRALAGRVPFAGTSLVETMQLVTSAPRPSLCALRPDLPPSVDTWVEHALAVDPARRFQHAQSFLDALRAALAGSALPPHTLPAASRHPDTARPPTTTPAERHNALSVALGRAASLLKRVASSLSRTPAALEPSDAPPEAPAPTPELAPPPPLPRAPQRAKPARLPRPLPREPEADLLIAELLPPSLPPPASNADEPAHLAPLAPLPTIAIEAPAEPEPEREPAPEPEPAPPLAPAVETPAAETPPALAKATKKTAVKRARKPRKRATPRQTTEAAAPPKSARTSQRPAAKAASKKAPQRRTAKPAPNGPPTTNDAPKRRTKKASVDATLTKPKARKKRATKPGPSQPPASPKPAKPATKSTRAKSGRVSGAQASKRSST